MAVRIRLHRLRPQIESFQKLIGQVARIMIFF